MMKLTKKLLIASLSIAMVCSLFAGAFSFKKASVKADEVSVPNSITYKFSEELSKITYTADELTAFNAINYPNGDGWNGTYGAGDVDAKAAFLKTVFEKSAIEVYSGYNSAYTAKPYYAWAGDGNSWRYSYVAVNGVGAGNWGGSLASNLNGTATGMGVYAGANGLSWGLAVVAPENGTITIPASTLNLVKFSAKDATFVATGNEALKIGFSKSSTVLTTLKPTDASLNMQAYAVGEHAIAEQKFEVAKGDRVYITLYTDMGSLVSDGRAVIDWDPSFVFEKEAVEVNSVSYKLSEELSKIGYTDEELTASGWNGTSRDANKQALLKTAYEKSAIEVYGAYAASSPAYNSKYYYDWADDGNSWRFSYTHVAGLSSGNIGSTQERIDKDNHHIIYSGSNGLVWGLALEAPEKGTITIPEHTIDVEGVGYGAKVLGMGISKSSSRHATLDPSNPALNMKSYAPYTVHTIPKQVFEVEAGERVYIVLFADTQGDFVSDSRVAITWDPSFVFEKQVEPEIPEEPEEEGVIQTTLAKEIGKIVITDEEKASTGWDGTLKASAAKEAAYKLAFEKSLLKFYAASGSAVDYRQMQYWDYAQDGNAWTMNYSGFSSNGVNGGLSAGTQTYNPSQNPRWEADGVHNIYSRAPQYHITWAIGFEAPEDGKIIIPEHTLVIDKLTNASALQLGYSLGTASRAKIKPGDASLNCVAYTAAGTYVIAEQVFNVKKGDMVYLNTYCDATGNDARASVTYNPTFRFETDPCVLHGHTEVVDAAKAPTCTETGLTEGKHCSVCNEVIVAQDVVDALGHDKVVSKTGYDATCTEDGLTDEFTCSVCGKSFAQETIPALGHAVVNHEAKAPTCTEIGWDAYETCSRCDYSTYVEKAALGHDMAQATCTLPATCSVCGHTEGEALGHAVINHEAKAPTCTEIGWDAYETCSRCDYSTYVEKAALGHDMAEATCVAPKTCKNGCGYTEGEALGHIEIVDEAVAPTCTETGLTEGKHCARCEEVLVAQESVEALGHDMAQATCTLPATCATCGHTEGSALGHVWEAATCVLPSTCSTCGETKGEALGHDMAPATCTQPSTCVNGCGLTEGDVLEHVYGEWEVVKVPTHIEEGVQKKACVHCGHEVEEVLPIDKNFDIVGCNGSISGSGLGLLLAAVSGALIIRKKRK